jgi:hypothetical protein
VARAPVFVGVGGGTTAGPRVLELAVFAEMQGVAGVVLNAPSEVDLVREVAMTVHVPVMATVVDFSDSVQRKIEAGARIINVAAGRRTAEVVAKIKERYPEVPLVASSGGSGESIVETIAAGANALTWTPPSAQDLQKKMMDNYRNGKSAHPEQGTRFESPASNSFYAQGATTGAVATGTVPVKTPRHKRQGPSI